MKAQEAEPFGASGEVRDQFAGRFGLLTGGAQDHEIIRVLHHSYCRRHPEPGLPATVSRLMKTSTLLFLGYGLEEWDFRALLRGRRSFLSQSGDAEASSSGRDVVEAKRRS